MAVSITPTSPSSPSLCLFLVELSWGLGHVELPALRWPHPPGSAWRRLKQPELDGQQKTPLKIEVPGWQEGDDKLVQAKLNWDLAEWESNQNSKVFCLNQQTEAELPNL